MRKSLPAALCALSLVLALITPAAAAREELPLDLRDHWSAPYVITLLEAGMVSGYPDGRFRPDQALTRQEAVSLLYRLLPASAYPDATALANTPLYPDVTEAWSQEMTRALLALGALDNESTFRPTEPMTRGDMARYTAKVLALLDALRPAQEAPPSPVDAPAASPGATGVDAETPAEPVPTGVEKSPDTGAAQQDDESFSPQKDPGGATAAQKVQTEAGTTEPAPATGNPADGSPDQDANDLEIQGQSEAADTGEPEQDPGAGETPPTQAGNASTSGGTASEGLVTLAQVRQELASGAPLIFADSGGVDGGLYIQFLYRRGVITGSDTGTYRPQDALTRGQAAAMLFRASGLPLTSTTFAPLPTSRVIDVPYLSQVYPVNAPVGCEATSLLMGLKGKGYAQDIDLRTFLDNLPRSSSDPAKGFVGSPYVADPTKKTRTTIYPPKLAEYGNQYGNVIDLSGASLPELQREVLSGNPVVVYVTLYWEKPFYRWYSIEGQQQRLLSNNHALLLCGYDAANNAYYVADPYNIQNRYEDYYYWVAGATFEPLYLERCHAVTIAD